MSVTSAGESPTRFTTLMSYFNVTTVSFFQFILACYNVAGIVALICMKVHRKGGELLTRLNLLLRYFTYFQRMQVWPAVSSVYKPSNVMT